MNRFLWLLPVAIFAFLIFLSVVFWINNPVDQSSTAIKWPYVLVVTPSLVTQGHHLDIAVSILDNRTRLEGTVIEVIDPFGHQYSQVLKSNSYTVVKYPDDFVGSTTTSLGNYTIVLLSNPTSPVVSSSSFDVVYNPSLTLFMQFVFGSGLAITIGLIASLITLLYQVGSQELADRERKAEEVIRDNTRKAEEVIRDNARKAEVKNQDHARKLNEKARWMLDNSKTYLALGSASSYLLSGFKSAKYPNTGALKPKIIVYGALQFYRAYDNFLKMPGFYYFDNLVTEDFIQRLDRKIFDDYYENMLCDYGKLRPFFNLSYDKIIDDSAFNSLVSNAEKWLADKSNSLKLYEAHFVNFWILRILVNKALKVIYTNEDALEKELDEILKEDRETLQACLDSINKIFFKEDSQSYFKLFDTKNNLLK